MQFRKSPFRKILNCMVQFLKICTVHCMTKADDEKCKLINGDQTLSGIGTCACTYYIYNIYGGAHPVPRESIVGVTRPCQGRECRHRVLL